MIAMADQFRLPDGFRLPPKPAGKRPAAKATPKRDHLIRALWGLLDGETLAALTGVEKSVLLCVAAWADWGTGEVRLARGSLAKHTGHAERACRRSVDRLIEIGVLTVVRAGCSGRGHSTIYRVEKRGRSGHEKGAAPSVKGGVGAPPNKDDPRIIQGGAAEAAPPTGENGQPEVAA
jgi:hypothetical protein